MDEGLNGKKLDNLAETVGEVKKTVDEIKSVLVGDTKNPEKKGLLERVRSIEKWIEEQVEGKKWANRLVVAAILGNSIGLIFVIIKYVLFPK